LWRHVGPSSSKTLRFGPGVAVEQIVANVQIHISAVVVNYEIPSELERRFNWLTSDDGSVKKELLNHLRNLDKSLVPSDDQAGRRSCVELLVSWVTPEPSGFMTNISLFGVVHATQNDGGAAAQAQPHARNRDLRYRDTRLEELRKELAGAQRSTSMHEELLIAKYETKISRWEAEGYDVSDIRTVLNRYKSGE